MAKHLFLVFTAPQPGREAEFNSWYDDQHLADVLRVRGFTAAQRFTVAPALGSPDLLPGYLSIYEIEADDPEEALGDLTRCAGTSAMPISDALNAEACVTLLARPVAAGALPSSAPTA